MCRGIDIERIDRWAARNHFSVFPLENTQNRSRHPRVTTRAISEPSQRERGPEREGRGTESWVRVPDMLASRDRHVMERKHKKTTSVSRAGCVRRYLYTSIRIREDL